MAGSAASIGCGCKYCMYVLYKYGVVTDHPGGGGGERVHEHSSRRQIVNFWLGVLLSSTFLLPFVHKIVFFIQTYVVMYVLYVSISSQQMIFFFFFLG